MTKAGESILRGAREALAYADGEQNGYNVHIRDVKASGPVDVNDMFCVTIGLK